MSGEIVHIEISGGAETRRARAFWSGLFDWQFEEVPVTDPSRFKLSQLR